VRASPAAARARLRARVQTLGGKLDEANEKLDMPGIISFP
jgi:hypothetical protein